MTTSPIVDCGHEAIPQGVGTGYAHLIDGRRVCYSCADEAQRRQVVQDHTFVGYLDSDARRVTTWTGGELAKVTRTKPTADDKVSVWAVTPDGRYWYGRGAGRGMVLTMRTIKS
jgi:hypothetical protein